MNRAECEAHIEAIRASYEPRVLAILTSIGEAFRAAEWGWNGTIDDLTDGEYAWGIVVRKPGHPVDDPPADDDVDVRFDIAEERENEGGDGLGIAFNLAITKVGGEVVGGMCPDNYSNDLWIAPDDRAAIEKRFSLFECANPAEAVVLCGGRMT